MKFSYTLLKTYLPELTTGRKLAEALTTHSFETEAVSGKTLEVSIPSNRYADAASHIGLAREAQAVLGLRKSNAPKLVFGKTSPRKGTVSVSVREPSLCPRYIARECTDVRVGASPKWAQTVLAECGLRAVNNVVDATNIAMLETGQPLHAFDADKVQGGIVVRRAKKGERFTTIDGKPCTLTPDMLVIADGKGPLALAGVKGGDRAAVSKDTERIILEAADFDSRSVYRTSKAVGLSTDASLRFSHAMSPLLPEAGMHRVSDLLREFGAAKPGAMTDTAPRAPRVRHLTFSPERFSRLTGLRIGKTEVSALLKRLSFSAVGSRVTIPPLRGDIENDADLAEEIVRLYGYDNVPSEAPRVRVGAHETDEHFTLADFVRDALVAFGFDEVYNDSFVPAGELAVRNPLSRDKTYLRESVVPLLLRNVSDNLRFYDTVNIFEIGKVFSRKAERYTLGIAAGSKSADAFFAVKGAVEGLLEALGLTDFTMDEAEDGHGVVVKSERKMLGTVSYETRAAYAELDLEQLLTVVAWERMFQPMPKYPAIVRDLSLSLAAAVKIGKVMECVELFDTELIEDVDLVDEYFDESGVRQSITLRIVFRAADRTLSAEEVDTEMANVASLLKQTFGVEAR